MIGQTIAHYTLEELLGEGPHGSSYRARDNQSGRVVTLKVLPAAAHSTEGQRRKFEQESMLVSSLNHPTIVPVLEVGNVNGLDYVVKEYVSAEPLEVIMRRRRLRRKEAVIFGLQIAEALSAAHQAEVPHGDLKPSNILVVGKKRFRVNDFATARLSEGRAYSATSLPKGTTAERVAYLAPEQVEGCPADLRTDIFAFGSLLYQMATGRWAFRKEWPLATLDAILRQDPRPVQQVTRRPIKGLEKVLERCLKKDPAQRFAHMSDLTPALRKLKEDYESGATARHSFFTEHWERIMQVVFATILLAAVAAGGYMWHKARSSNTDVRVSLTRLTSEEGLDTEPAISPRGELIAFASDRGGDDNLDLWVRPFSGSQLTRLTTHPADDHEPAFSPDGSLIAFRSERDGGGVYVVPVQGGEARLVAPSGRRPRFSPDGRSIAYWVGPPGLSPLTEGDSKIFLVDVQGGASLRLHEEFASAAYPVWSPDGYAILFFGRMDPDRSRGETPDWWVAPLKPGPAIQTGACAAMRRYGLLEEGGCAIPGDWTTGDWVIFSRPTGDAAHLYRAKLTTVDPHLNQPPRRMTSADALEIQPYGAWDGRFVFSRQILNADIFSLPVDLNAGKPTGPLKRVTQDRASDVYPTLSADGRKLVFQSNRQGFYSPWVLDFQTSQELPVTTARQDQLWPRISPDGRQVVFSEQRIGMFEQFLAPLGPGSTDVLCRTCGSVASDWSADASHLLVETLLAERPPTGISLVRPGSTERVELLRHPQRPLNQARYAPDGRWITFVMRVDQGHSRIYLAPNRGSTPVPPADWIALTAGASWDTAPQFSPDSRLVYYTSSRDGSRCIWAQRIESSGKPGGDPFAVYHFHVARRSPSLVPFNGVDLFAGSGQLLISLGDLSGNIWSGKPSE